jgi:cytochrome P450
MNTPAPLSPDVLGTPEAIADPYPAYRAFRGPTPVRYVRLPAGAFTGLSTPLYSWALLRHADVVAALRDTATFSSEINAVNKAIPKLALVHDDPPRHTHLRRLVSKAFSAQRIASLSDWIGRIVHELLDAAGRGPVEFMAAYAVPLPLRVIATMLGIPDKDYPMFRRWSEAIAGYAGISAEERALKAQEMKSYVDQAIAARRAQPTADLLSVLVQAEVEGASLSDAEIHSFARVLLVAGHETTTNLIGNMAALLADRPELWRRVREDRTLVEPIIEEVLRYESPVQRIFARDNPARAARRCGDRRGRAGRYLLWSRQPGPCRLRGAGRVPAGAPGQQPTRGVRARHPLLPGRAAGPARGSHHAECTPRSLPRAQPGRGPPGAAAGRPAELGLQVAATRARLSRGEALDRLGRGGHSRAPCARRPPSLAWCLPWSSPPRRRWTGACSPPGGSVRV